MIVSIIICTRNRAAALRETLRSMDVLSIAPGLEVELIIVDNGSTDGTAAVVKGIVIPKIRLRYVHEPAGGKSCAQNTGVASATGEVIVFTDDDVRPAPAWFNAITEPIIAGRFDALAGCVNIAPHLLRPWMTNRHKAWLASTDYLNTSEPEGAVSANMAVARRVFARVPRFDPELGPGRLGFWDDTLFSLQLKKAGYRLGLAADAVVEHHFDVSRLSRNAFLARAAAEGRSLAYVTWHWKHETRALPVLRAARREMELRLKRKLRAQDWPHAEGIAPWEMDLVTATSFLRYFSDVRSQPRAYEKYGLHKVSAQGGRRVPIEE